MIPVVFGIWMNGIDRNGVAGIRRRLSIGNIGILSILR